MFKLRIPNLLFTLAAGISGHIMPMAGERGPRQSGKPLAFDRNGRATDSYGVTYERASNGVIRRTSPRLVSLKRLTRGFRKQARLMSLPTAN
jgi:hypothetical protein